MAESSLGKDQTKEEDEKKNEKQSSPGVDDKEEENELERLAVEELLKDAKRAKERADRVGPIGWQRGPSKTNKRFLFNTLEGTMQANKRVKVTGQKESSKFKRRK
ncbi:protein POLR1D-like [Dysidea avara]|uniref:protein POLR1D-like n=1 Tax=Dysidea avara TaxID=196820 RepID=UPI00332AFC84